MGWVVVSIIWLIFCLFVSSIYPVFDGRKVLGLAIKLAWRALRGKGLPEEKGTEEERSEDDGQVLSDQEPTKPGKTR